MGAPLTSAFAALAIGAAFAAPAAARDRLDPIAMLSKSDANGDGRVTRTEFIEARRDRFQRMDRTGDGYVSDDDLPRMLRKRAGEKMDRAIDAFDSNRDGRLSRAEFVDGPTRLFDVGDANRDGAIDRAELARLADRVSALRGP